MKTIAYYLIASLLIILLSLTSALGEVFFYHTDNFGTPMAMTDMSGEVVWRADELPFGEEYETVENPIKNNRRFLGKELDETTGLICMGFRYLDPDTGRFTQPDPVRLVDPATGKINQEMLLNPQRQNRYVYGLNNPYKYVDPDGEFAFLAVAVLSAGMLALDAMVPQTLETPNSKGALDYIDRASVVVPVGSIRNVTKLSLVGNQLKGMPLSEAKQLVSTWGKGSYNSLAGSIKDHAKRHGFGDDIPKYLRKAANFNKKGAKVTNLENGATRWNRKNGEFLIERDKKIVSYGKNK